VSASSSRPGTTYPLGARWDGQGVDFVLYGGRAERVQLCLFDAEGSSLGTHALHPSEGGIWSLYLEGLGPGVRYGYRLSGPWAPAQGCYYNPRKLLLDPYARVLSGPGAAHPALAAATPAGQPDPRDSAPWVPLGVVVDEAFEWGPAERHPRTPWDETVLYEAHVKGLTKLMESAGETAGTYAGLGDPRVISHLQALGVTALELLPIHARVPEAFLVEKGLTNYWGYASLGFFAPHLEFAGSTDPLAAPRELKGAIRALHAAGIEVILDVVYNHTAEGGPGGPCISFRGLAPDYYRIGAEGNYEDFTGCGNTLDLRRPRTLQLVLDSLRYWVEEYHVDGFRFDLAPALAREEPNAAPLGEVFAVMLQDPVLAQVKLIAEPWDLGHDGYRLGAFPPGWREWNGEYRDGVRRFWRGDSGRLGDFAERFCGSSDRFSDRSSPGRPGRGPLASINYVTCHDGFTLRDLVSYERKHNLANLEDNRDGHEPSHSKAWGGPEGPCPEAEALRSQVQRAFLLTLACSQGVPMLNMGDERSRTQGGNNNAYCQDNELSWLDWSETDATRALEDFVQRAFDLRRRFPQLRRVEHFRGRRGHEADLHWLRPDGGAMRDEDWPEASSVSAWIEDAAGAPELLILIHAPEGWETFRLPPGVWNVVLESATGSGCGHVRDTHAIEGPSLSVLARVS
jgi:isoamylase